MPRYTIRLCRVRAVPGGPRIPKRHIWIAADYDSEADARRQLEADGTLRVVRFIYWRR